MIFTVSNKESDIKKLITLAEKFRKQGYKDP